MVTSFSLSFPALFLTCVFLVSTQTTLSFTSDLDTQAHKLADTQTVSSRSFWGVSLLSVDSLLDAEVGQSGVQEGKRLVG